MGRVSSCRPFPRYAFLPGRHPHPVRDASGHSHDVDEFGADATLDDKIRWGFDLFSHGYYWEAHEAWEEIWTAASRSSQQWTLMKGLILLAASGVKLRTGKAEAAQHHARRASSLLRRIVGIDAEKFESLCGVAPEALADLADQVVHLPEAVDAEIGAPPEVASAYKSLSGKT